MKTAIIIGASSGIGRALALELANRGWRVVVMARRLELLAELQDSHDGIVAYQQLDVTELEEAAAALNHAMKTYAPVDAVVISAGIGEVNKGLLAEIEASTIKTNVSGFTNLAREAARAFEAEMASLSNASPGAELPKRLLAAITSVSGPDGSANRTSYAASKAYQSSYLQGLRLRWQQKHWPIQALDVRPGFVAAGAANGDYRGLFWVAAPEEAARQIANAVEKHRSVVYVTKGGWLREWLIQLLPAFLVNIR